MFACFGRTVLPKNCIPNVFACGPTNMLRLLQQSERMFCTAFLQVLANAQSDAWSGTRCARVEHVLPPLPQLVLNSARSEPLEPDEEAELASPQPLRDAASLS